ncbi:MAG: acetyl-CoA carboxylase biotin carboxyl carrier protein [Candidatus Limnocylindrales bacterium]
MANEQRQAAERLADHAAIDALADELIPALIAKLGASGLGEIEVREGAWKVRLRRPADASAPGPSGGRRGGERAGRGAPAGGAAIGAAVGAARPALTPVGPGRQGGGLEDGDGRAIGATAESGGEASARSRDPFRAIATSPAVGFYQPRPGIAPGSRVRTGDPIGAIDVLGVPTEVVAPADGIVGASLVEPGEAVEYGQELVWVELLSSPPAADVPIEP